MAGASSPSRRGPVSTSTPAASPDSRPPARSSSASRPGASSARSEGRSAAGRGERLGDDVVDVGLGAAVVHDARPEREPPAYGGVGEVDPPPANHPEQQILGGPGQLGVAVPAVPAVPEP